MFSPDTIRYFARDVLTLACDNPCTWAALEPLERTSDAAELVVRMRLSDAVGNVVTIDDRDVPMAARMAANHSLATANLKVAVLQQDARFLEASDAQAIVQQVAYRAIRHA